MFSKKIIFFLIFVLVAVTLSGQCLMFPVSFSDRTNSSAAVVEGKVISQYSFWNNAHNFIYTASEIEIYKIFKGTIATSQLVVFTEGGIVGNDMIVAEPALRLMPNDVGIFFLQPSVITNPVIGYPAGVMFEPYASGQGFIKYDLTDMTARDVYNSYTNVSAQLYQPITALVGHTFNSVVPFNINDYGSSYDRALPVISAIAPLTTTAGTFAASLITITGNNFGTFTASAKLEFPDANNGGAGYILTPANHIIVWNNTTITAWVVTGAGSGLIRITNNTNETTTSGISLTVNYNETNVTSGGIYYQPDLVNRNATGGYVFKYNTTFNGNAPAVAAFERALQTWRCSTYVNFSRNGTTAISSQALDGTNVVTFDGSSALPAGVLGISYSYYSGCSGAVWYLNENDLKFRTNGTGGINWNYGPAPTAGGLFDFESVNLHELGHSHQLGHTILPVTVMNYAVGPNTDRRTLTAASELAGGLDIMSRSVVNNACGPTAMIALTNTNCPINAPVADFSGAPTSGCNSVTVNFTDLSTSSPTSWSWSFPGGVPAVSALQNPAGIVYGAPGTYNVTLVVTNASGSDTRTYSSYITVNNCPPPTSYFYGAPTTICAGQTVAFFDTSTNTPTSWSWTFPGGTPGTSTTQNPVITYSVGGTYNVTLTATNAYGSNTLTRTAYITVNNCPPPPVANFTGTPTTLCAGNTVTFTDLSTNSPTSWSWTFPGGTPSTSVLQNPVITYSTAGVYNVTLVASNSSGSNLFTRTNYITVNTCAAPVINFSGWPSTICVGQSVNFTDLSTNSPTSWSWTFPGGVPGSSALQNPVVNYAAAGSYNVTLTATNGFGSNTLTRTAYINVNTCPPSGTGLIVNDGSLIFCQPAALVTIQGGLINQDNGANIGNIDNSGLITLTGDWTNNSVSNAFINSSPGETQFLGSSQLITGSTPTYFYNLTLLGSGIKTQTLDARTLGTLALNDRELNTADYVMYVTNASTAAITRTGGFNSTPVQGFVSSTNTGRLWRNTNSTGTYLFPVGSSLVSPRYRPVEIKPAASSANTFAVRFVNNDANVDGYNRNNKDVNLGVINSYWYQKTNRVSGTNAADIVLYFDNVADAVAAVPMVLMTEWGFGVSPIQWRDMGAITPVAAASPALSKVTKTAWNTYTTENFNIAPQSVPLPVDLIGLHAVCTVNGVEVSWSTASEINSDYFSVERSTNGSSYESVGITPAAGNSNSVRNYSITDEFTPDATVYYCLVQTDFDGTNYRYGPVALNCRIHGSGDYAEIFPNPFTRDIFVLLNLSESGNVRLTITNVLGQSVRNFSFSLLKGTHQLPLSLDNLAPGLYNLSVNTNSRQLVVKMIKEK